MEAESARPKFGVLKEQLGAHLTSEDSHPHYRYPNVYELQPDRILATVSAGHVDLVLKLVSNLPPPYEILYALLAADEDSEGRYVWPSKLDFGAVSRFMNRYRDFFEQDARHDVWIRSEANEAQVVYDHHNVLYLYGERELFEGILVAEGLTPGSCEIPYPHFHNFKKEFDGDQDEILATPGIVKFPLTEQDLD